MSHEVAKIKWKCKYCKKIRYIKPYIKRIYCSQRCNGLDHLEQHSEILNRVRPTSEQAKINTFRIYAENPGIKKQISNTLKSKNIKPPSRLGTKSSELQKAKAREALLKTRHLFGVKGKMTDIEKIIDSYLKLRKVKYEFEYTIGIKSVDFYLFKTNQILEADGEYWHKDKDELKRDMYIKSLMPEVNIIHLPEKDIKNGNWINLWGGRFPKGVI